MSKTLSVLIVENFVINEGPKWDKFKKGIKKVGHGAVAAAGIGAVALAGGGYATIHNADRDHRWEMSTNQTEHQSKRNDLNINKSMDINNINSDGNTTPETKNALKSQIEKNYNRDLKNSLNAKNNKEAAATYIRDRAHAEGKQALVGSGGLAGIGAVGAVALAAGSKGEKKKQAKKSLKERLNLVKSGMFLNEEPADITALRNKISQGLILLPGLKGSAADKMEDSIRGWEDQINELEKK